MTDQAPNSELRPSDQGWALLFAAWLMSLVATLGALFVGEVMGQEPCSLCWYQRAFMFPLPIVLGIALLRNDVRVWVYALPLSATGMLLAAYHMLEYIGVIPPSLTPCTATGPSCSGAGMTLWGWIPIPLLALIAFAAISGALALIQRRPDIE